MKAAQLDQALRDKFERDEHRVVFWHDEDGEFAAYVDQGLDGPLAGVAVLDLRQTGPLSAKLRLEREEPEQRFLVYSQGAVPAPEADWLLDIRLYSGVLRADVASIWLQDLGLQGLYLRDHLKTRARFLASQERRKKLGARVHPLDDEAALDLKMMAVVTGSAVATPLEVLRALCHGHAVGGAFDLSSEPEALAALGKYGLGERFWALMKREFGYQADAPSLGGLLRRVFVSELSVQLDAPLPASLRHFALRDDGQRQASVFLTQWRDSTTHGPSYNAAAHALEAELKVSEALAGLGLDAMRGVTTFWIVERRVATHLQRRLLDDGALADLEALGALVIERKAAHWLAGPGSDAPVRRALSAAYDALLAAAGLFSLHAQVKPQLDQVDLGYASPEALLQGYVANLHRFDRLYRDYCTAARPAQHQGWDLLKAVGEAVEKLYGKGFLYRLGVAWSRHLDEGFLQEWRADALPPQQDFYARVVRSQAEGRGRAFVVISDAFRYEAAVELVERLNGQDRVTAGLSPMLGVLPSYTALGMASLLPHRELAYTDKGDVLADGVSTSGTAGRGKVLDKVGGVAVLALDLLKANTQQARDLVGDAQVVYIYHNVIDARGDTAATEDETFEAVQDCLKQLQSLVRICTSKLSATKVFITADHGFLFRVSDPGVNDKSKLSHKPSGVVKMKKRYVIGRDLPEAPEAHRGTTAHTAGTTDAMAYWVPRGANRFHFISGARFVHGGAMPQEVVVPLVTVQYLRGSKAEQTLVQKVGVQVLGTAHKITTPVYRFFLLQTEAVSDRRTSLTARVAVYEGARPVTSVETVVFDSASKSMDELKQAVKLRLGSGPFDKSTRYRLVLRDVDTDAEVQSVPVVIDRSFDDDLF
jgi:uncharacterized protein (TIGR02687 family)